MDKMNIFIPTLGRYNVQNCTLDWLSAFLPHRPPWDELVWIVVQRHEWELYFKLKEKYGCNIICLPERITRIAPTRQFIAEHCKIFGIKKFVMMDDDLTFYNRRHQDSQDENEWWRLSGADPGEVYDMIYTMFEDLDTYAHVGISGREGNKWCREAWTENTRYMRVAGYQTDAYLSCELNRIDCMEDFDVELQLLEKGYPCKVYYCWAQGQGKSNEEGGCSVWRTNEVHNNAAQLLLELHPDSVSLRQKFNVSDPTDFGRRLEVTVQWKQAFRLGNHRRLAQMKQQNIFRKAHIQIMQQGVQFP